MPRMNMMDAVVGVMKDEGVAMGLSIDKINEYEPILDGARETSGQVVGGIPERD